MHQPRSISKDKTRWELKWLEDSQKYELCILLTVMKSKNVLGRKIPRHHFPKKNRKTCPDHNLIRFTALSHTTFYSLQVQESYYCHKLSQLLPHCWISEGVALVWSLALFVAKPHMKKTDSHPELSEGASPIPSILPFLSLASPSRWLCHLGQQQTCHSEPRSAVEQSRSTKSSAGPQHIWQSNCASLLMFVPLVKATLFSLCLSTARVWRRKKKQDRTQIGPTY